MKLQLMSVTLSALIAVLAGCDKKESPASETRVTSAPIEDESQVNAKTTPAPAPIASGDKDFLTEAAQGGMLEVLLGQQISRDVTTPEVKAFGEQMITDHGKANDELRDLATRKGATLPTELDSKHQKAKDKLAKLGGTKLEKEYADDMVEDHETDVKEFKKAAQDLKDPDLRAWAAKTLPVLEHHLMMAKDMKAKMKHAK